MDISIINCSSEILGFFLPVVVLVEPRVSDGIYVDRDSGRWFPKYSVVDWSMASSREGNPRITLCHPQAMT